MASVPPTSSNRPSHRPVRPTVVVITGLSGAGKSTALHALEDLGFYCVDNLPTALATQAVELCEQGHMYHVAFGIDVRVRAFLGAVEKTLAHLRADGKRDLHVVFLDATDEVLMRRFSETRRPHPHDAGHKGVQTAAVALLDELNIERERLAPLRAAATHVIDTSTLSVHDLRRTVVAQFSGGSGGGPPMWTRVVSFGFKYGVPTDADVVFDVRFLVNPYFIPKLKALPGTEKAVADFVFDQPEAREFFAKTLDFILFALPKYEREGKTYLTIAIGCTGGRHRSVAMAEALAERIAEQSSSAVTLVHRDVLRSTGGTPPVRVVQAGASALTTGPTAPSTPAPRSHGP